MVSTSHFSNSQSSSIVMTWYTMFIYFVLICTYPLLLYVWTRYYCTSIVVVSPPIPLGRRCFLLGVVSPLPQDTLQYYYSVFVLCTKVHLLGGGAKVVLQPGVITPKTWSCPGSLGHQLNLSHIANPIGICTHFSPLGTETTIIVQFSTHYQSFLMKD